MHLTKTDFTKLQLQLENCNSSRSSGSYVAADVLAVKLDFLRSRKPINVDADACLATSDRGSNINLVPQAVVDTSSTLADPMDVDSGADSDVGDADADSDVSDADFGAFSDSPSYILADTAELSTIWCPYN